MFGRIKNLFRRRTEEAQPEEAAESSFPPREFQPGYTPGARQPAHSAPPSARPEAAMDPNEQPSIGDSIRLMLKPVLLMLPDALRSRVRHPPSGGVQISIPLQKVLSQLQQGSVKISFGELRQASPAGVFAEQSDQDQASVELPLAEILSQLKPEQLPRRAGQRKVEVPEAVTGLFGAKGQPLTSVRMGSPSSRAPIPQAPAAPVAPEPARPIAPVRPITPEPARSIPAEPIKMTPIVTGPTPARAFRPAAPVTPPVAPQEPIRPSQPLPTPPAPRAPAAAPAAPVTPITHIAPTVAPTIVTPTSVAPTPTPEPPAVPVETLTVPLSQLTGNWPAPIHQALTGLPNATVGVPTDELEQSLKRGKIAFAWKRVRSWISPAPPPSAAAALDETVLDLPLSVIAPLFLAKRKPVQPQKKYTITEHIPDVFAGKGMEPSPQVQVAAPITPTTPAPPATPDIGLPPAAPAPARPAPAPAAARVAAPVPATPQPLREIGEVFGQPGRKNWTPSEIVQRSSALRGVAGALIAMPDGLLVAGHLPPGLNPETIAAFLPQMHSRMAQYSKELKFGEGNTMTLIVDDVPLRIFKTGGVFFTVLGRPGEPLPEAHLKIVAAQLGPQNK